MLLSVVIPVYNGAETIERCLKSIEHQSVQTRLEVLVADDGSTDGTMEILRAHARTHEYIKVLPLTHRGQAAARNEALSHATGDWVCFLDADDYWDETYLEHILPDLNEGIDVLQTGYKGYVCTRKYRFLSAWSKVIRRTFLTEHNILFPEGMYYDDPVWAARLWQEKPRIALSASTDYNYTFNSQSVTANPKPTGPVRRELRRMGLRLWDFGWLRLRLAAHFIKTRVTGNKA